MGEQSLTCFAYVCFMPRNDGGFLPYCCAYHELCVRTVLGSVAPQRPSYNSELYSPIFRQFKVSANGGLLRICLSSQNFLFLLRMSVIFKFPSILLRNLLLISSAHELEQGVRQNELCSCRLGQKCRFLSANRSCRVPLLISSTASCQRPW